MVPGGYRRFCSVSTAPFRGPDEARLRRPKSRDGVAGCIAVPGCASLRPGYKQHDRGRSFRFRLLDPLPLSPRSTRDSPTRAIVFLAVAGFASQAMVRSADSLLPQIAADLGVTVGAASVIVSSYTVMHGSMQL